MTMPWEIINIETTLKYISRSMVNSHLQAVGIEKAFACKGRALPYIERTSSSRGHCPTLRGHHHVKGIAYIGSTLSCKERVLSYI